MALQGHKGRGLRLNSPQAVRFYCGGLLMPALPWQPMAAVAAQQ